MRKKHPVPLTQKFPNADPLAVHLLGRLLAFDPKDRPSAEEVNMRVLFSSTFVLTISRTHVYVLICYNFVVFLTLQALADPYFATLSNVEREPSRNPISKLEFEFERRKVTKDDVRELIYREVEKQSLFPGFCS
jgi:mitogen-activated protein kinase 1/3